jgi:lipopolysaccharide export system protein LptA
MKAQRASTPTRLAALAAAAAMLILMAAVAVKLVGRRQSRPAAAAVKPLPESQAGIKERVKHEEYLDGRLRTSARGDRAFKDPDGRDHLEGSVEVVNHGPAGEALSRLAAERIVFDKGAVRFAISGSVRVEAGGAVLEGDAFEYDRDRGVLRTDSGGTFTSADLAGRAPEISYSEGTDEVRLGGGFRVEMAAQDGTDRALVLSGDSFAYERRERRGRINGRAGLECADFRGAATAASFVASPDEASLESAVFDGDAKVVFAGREPAGEGSGEIRADRIAVSFSREPSGLAVQATGRSRLSLRSAADRAETVLAPTALLNFSRADGRWTWSATGGIRAEITEAGELSRALEGQEAVFDGAKVLGVSGGPGRPAVADSAEARIEAPAISVASAPGCLFASGGVACVLKGGEGRRKVGFFSPQEDVAFSSDKLEIRPEISTSLLTGNVRVSQGANALRAGEVELAGDAGGMSGAGGVVVTLTEAAEGQAPARTIELGGQEMGYSPGQRTLILTSKAYVRLPEAGLEAGRVSALVGREGKGVESLSAADGVVVSKGRYVGRGEAALYEAATGRLTLTGKPVLTDAQGGSIRGDKLTFDLADDKILVENEGQGRSATVIKS